MLPLCVDDHFASQYWTQQATLLHWFTPWQQLHEHIEDGPRQRWFAGGETNLCYNALDRHLPAKRSQTAIIHCDRDGVISRISYGELLERVEALAWMLKRRGVAQGERVMICLPGGPLAVAAMLACARIGAVHVVTYSGTALTPLIQRIRACAPLLLLCNDQTAEVCRQTSGVEVIDCSAAALCLELETLRGRAIPCVALPADAPSHILFTSGTTGTPKGIVRDTGGYGVALLASLKHLFALKEEEIFFTSADVGWVTGHSYGVYGPLLAGITTLMVEAGTHNAPGTRWWSLIAELGVTRLLTIPGAMRLARRQGVPAVNLNSLRGIWLAGEPLDRPTEQWLSALGLPVQNHYWQTESGWPILSGSGDRQGAVMPRSVEILDDETGAPCAPDRPGMLVVRHTLGPGGMSTLWGDDVDHDQRYWRYDQGRWIYVTHDRAVRHIDGGIQVLGRMDDVINIGGKRLSTVEIESALQPLTAIQEAVAVRLSHPLLGEMPGIYVVTHNLDKAAQRALKKAIIRCVREACGHFALVRRVWFVTSIPRTFSGKVMRRAMNQQINR